MTRQADGFWGIRKILDDDDFALVERSREPDDFIDEKTWDGLMILSDTVAVETTSYQGTLIRNAQDIWSLWIHISSIIGKGSNRAASEASIPIVEELQSSVYLCVTGWYRQAFSSLRTAFELTFTAFVFDYCDDNGLIEWTSPNGSSQTQPVSRACKELRKIKHFKEIAELVSDTTLFNNGGWCLTHYSRLCDYAHARPFVRTVKNEEPAQNMRIWNSNGPVYRYSTVRLWYEVYAVTALSIAVLMLLVYPDLAESRDIFDGNTLLHYCKELYRISDNKPEWISSVVQD